MPDKKNRPSHIAIVGCGFTGTTTLHQLIHNHPVQRITVFESTGNFGPGYPYQTDETREYLLNNTNDTMCLEPSNRRAFVEWLQRQPKYERDLDEKASMPRAVYGEFLQDVIRQSTAAAKTRRIRVDFVADEVTDIDVDKDVELRTAKGSYRADLAVLATGRCPDYDVYDLRDAAADRYFPLHMPGTRLDVLPIDAEVHILGASLSAYDVVNQLFAASTGCRFVPDGPNRLRFEPNGNQRRVVLCSRSGRLKKVRSRHPLRVQAKHFSLSTLRASGQTATSLRQLFDLMQKDAADYGVRLDLNALSNPYAGCDTAVDVNKRAMEILGQDIDAAASPAESNANFIVDYANAADMQMWDIFAAKLLSPEEEAIFRSSCEAALLNWSAACPSLTAQKILALMQGGQLRIVPGVNAVRVLDDGAIEINHRFGTDRADYVVNASGVADRRVASDRQPPLIQSLQQKGLLQEYTRVPGATNGADVDLQSFQSAASDKLLVANMFLWGPGLYVSSAIMMATVVERMLAAAFADGDD